MSSAPRPNRSLMLPAGWPGIRSASGRVRVIARPGRRIGAASFLDDRMLQPPVVTGTRPFADVAAALPADARIDARWIPHRPRRLRLWFRGCWGARACGRAARAAGSCAISPRARRSAAEIALAIKTGSRTFAAAETALVKATSFVSEIARTGASGRARFVALRRSAQITSPASSTVPIRC